jgi:hypothetical protein
MLKVIFVSNLDEPDTYVPVVLLDTGINGMASLPKVI